MLFFQQVWNRDSLSSISFSFSTFVFFLSSINLKPLPERTEMICVTAGDMKKLLKVAQMESVKARLRGYAKSCIKVSEFVRICSEYCSDYDQAIKIANMLDDSAAVIMMDDVVFLQPEQVSYGDTDIKNMAL